MGGRYGDEIPWTIRNACDATDDNELTRAAMSTSERYAKLRDFARERHYGVSTVRRWIKEGMPHIGNGRSLRIKVPEAEAWLQARGARIHHAPIIESKVIQ